MTQASPAGQGAFLDLSARAKFRITRADRFRFLNGQITNDLRKASETVAVEACVLNAKGKMDAHVFVCALGECFLVDAAPNLREKLRARLERYVIADDVEVEDVTDQFSLFHVLSPELQRVEDGRVVSVQRFVEPGCDIWSDAAHRDALSQRLSSHFEFLDPVAAEVMRIEQGIPRWGCETRFQQRRHEVGCARARRRQKLRQGYFGRSGFASISLKLLRQRRRRVDVLCRQRLKIDLPGLTLCPSSDVIGYRLRFSNGYESRNLFCSRAAHL